MKMKMKKTIDMNVDGPKKTRTLEDGTVVTDSEKEDDQEEEYDGENGDEFVPPQMVFKDSSIRDPE
jgi:hypothetical protein